MSADNDTDDREPVRKHQFETTDGDSSGNPGTWSAEEVTDVLGDAHTPGVRKHEPTEKDAPDGSLQASAERAIEKDWEDTDDDPSDDVAKERDQWGWFDWEAFEKEHERRNMSEHELLREIADSLTQLTGGSPIGKDAETDAADADWGVTAPLVVKADDGEREQQKAWAPVLIPNETDKQGDVIPADEIEKAAHQFLAEFRNIDTDHDLLSGRGAPIESWTLKEASTFTLPDGGESREYPAGTWMLGVEFADQAWQRVKSGDLTGFSIYGEAEEVPTEAFGADPEGAGA